MRTIFVMAVNIRIEYTGKVGTNDIQFSHRVGGFATEEFIAKRTLPGTPPASTVSTNSPI